MKCGPRCFYIRVLPCEVHERSRNGGVVLDELPEIIRESQKLTDFCGILGGGPVFDHFNFLWIHSESSTADYMAEEFDFVEIKSAFFGFRVELIFLEYFEDDFQMFQVFFRGFGVDHNVIQVDHHKFV